MPGAHVADLDGRSYCCYSSSVLALADSRTCDWPVHSCAGALAGSVEVVVSRATGRLPVNWAKSSVSAIYVGCGWDLCGSGLAREEAVSVPTGGREAMDQQQRLTLPGRPVADGLATEDKRLAAFAPDTQGNLGEWH